MRKVVDLIVTCVELLSQHSAKPGRRSQQDMFIHSHPAQPITANLLSILARASQSRLQEFVPEHPQMQLSLAASAPHILQQTIPLRQPVQRVVALTHGSHESAECVNLALACESTILINLANGDLDGCMILGLDNAVGGTALSGDVTGKITAVSFKFLFFEGYANASPFTYWRDVQVDEFTLVVFHLGGFCAYEIVRSPVVWGESEGLEKWK